MKGATCKKYRMLGCLYYGKNLWPLNCHSDIKTATNSVNNKYIDRNNKGYINSRYSTLVCGQVVFSPPFVRTRSQIWLTNDTLNQNIMFEYMNDATTSWNKKPLYEWWEKPILYFPRDFATSRWAVFKILTNLRKCNRIIDYLIYLGRITSKFEQGPVSI